MVGNGTSVRFWLDWWSGDGPLADSFLILFSYFLNPQISILKLAANNWDLGLRRSLSHEELGRWQQLAALFPTLSEEGDAFVWPHSAFGRFSVKSLYSRLISSSISSRFSAIWRSWVPLRIKIFLWLAARGNLPAADQIRKRNGPGSALCALCGEREDSNHIIFFLCPSKVFLGLHPVVVGC